MTIRNLERWNCPLKSYASVDEFLSSGIGNGLHTIEYGDTPIDIQCSLQNGAPLVVILNGNFPRKEGIFLPAFSGMGVVTREMGLSRVCISDPTLHLSDDISLGWYGGHASLELQKILPLLIGNVAKHARASSILFAGGSGGGFSSLYYSASFPGSTALVWNPQTDIRRYHPDHVIRYARVAFGADPDIESARACLTQKILPDVAPLHEAGDVKVVYLQNDTDGHTKDHLGPFLDKLSLDKDPLVTKKSDRIDVYAANWGDGHVPPPKALITDLVKGLAGPNIDTSAVSHAVMHAHGMLPATVEKNDPLPSA